MRQPTVSESTRAALCAARTITLNGQPASVSGIKNQFATVVQRVKPNLRAEFSWAAVSRAYVNETDLTA